MKKWEKPELIELDIKKTAYGTKQSDKIDDNWVDSATGVKYSTYS